MPQPHQVWQANFKGSVYQCVAGRRPQGVRGGASLERGRAPARGVGGRGGAGVRTRGRVHDGVPRDDLPEPVLLH